MRENLKNGLEEDLIAQLEALLFVANSPVSISQLSSALDKTEGEIKRGLEDLKMKFEEESGLQLQEMNKKFQLTTRPELSGIIEKFLGIEVTTTLSQASLEALAIIAYKQPITRPEIDGIRGVNSDGVVRNLLSKGLIEEVGRVEAVGRPILYSTTEDFLSYFGLSSLEELPAFEVLPVEEKETNGILKD